MKAFVFLLLFSFATNAVAEPKFGPEIEFLGARHVPALICTPLYTVGLMAGAGSLPFTAAWFFFEARNNRIRSEEEANPDQRDHAKYGLASSAGLFATGASCMLSSHLNGDAGSRRYLARLRADLEKDAARGLVKVEEVAEGNQSWRKAVMATYPDGTKIIFGKDPAAVEVKLSPITSAEMDKRIDFLDRELYARARAVGLRVPRADGPWNGGHLHVDIAGAFGGDPRRLRNFIFDFIEHGELADGVLVKDAISARPITVKKRAQTLAAFGAHMDNLAAAGKKLTPLEIYYLAEGFPTLFAKGLALNINPQFGTLEIRSLRSQADAGTLARVMRLFDARIKHTNSLPPLPVPTVDHVGLAPTAKAARYREYVEGAGLRYEEYRGLAAPRFREGGCAVKFGWFGR